MACTIAIGFFVCMKKGEEMSGDRSQKLKENQTLQ